MRLVQLTTPTNYPVTVAQAREQCALYGDTTHDDLLTRYIKVATSEVENYTGAVFVERNMCLYMDGFQSSDIDLRTYPVQSVTSIKYDDADNSEQTLSSSDYYTSLYGMGPTVRPVDYWPSTYQGKPSSARITFVAGYSGTGDSPVDMGEVPEDIKQAILMRVYEMFENRGDGASFALTMANPYRRISV